MSFSPGWRRNAPTCSAATRISIAAAPTCNRRIEPSSRAESAAGAEPPKPGEAAAPRRRDGSPLGWRILNDWRILKIAAPPAAICQTGRLPPRLLSRASSELRASPDTSGAPHTRPVNARSRRWHLFSQAPVRWRPLWKRLLQPLGLAWWSAVLRVGWLASSWGGRGPDQSARPLGAAMWWVLWAWGCWLLIS